VIKLQRLLVVGLGSIGTRHVRLIRTLIPDVQITVLRHRSCQGLLPLGIDHCVTTLEDALLLRPQAAVIANPATHHLEIALPLAQSGVHLLIEKPIAASSSQVSDLIAICQNQGVVLMVAYQLRFLLSLQHFRKLLNQERIGRVYSVRAEIGQFLPDWRPTMDYRQNVSAQANLGGGVLLELSHEIDYLRWLFGDVLWVNAVIRKQSALEIDVEDVAYLILGFNNPTSGNHLIASLGMDFLRHDTTRTCTVIGETGTLRWNALTGTVDIFSQGGSTWQTLFVNPTMHRDDAYLAEWHHFLECIYGKETPLISGQDGLAVLQIIEAARRSSQFGTVVGNVYGD
jgi:predicted dehydrogenase